MCSVYGASTINIAAAGAKDGGEGCFFSREEGWCCLLKGDAEQPFLTTFNGNYLWERMRKMPLTQRGWVVQERVLARPTIFFTRTELFWECDELAASENFPDGCLLDDQIEAGPRIGFQKRPMTLKAWEYFLKLYTSATLSMSKDKLIAISGIARAVHAEVGDEYVAGLWGGGSIEHQLLWTREYSPFLHGLRPALYRAPGWVTFI